MIHLFKKYWWIIPTILGFLFLIIIITNLQKKAFETKIHNTNIFTGETKNPRYMDNSFTQCPVNLAGLFTKEPIDNTKVDYIIPLGMLNASSHTIPTDHIYMMSTTPNEHLPVYAPADATVIGGENKMTYDSKTNELKRNDFSLDLIPCKGLVLNFTHFQELSPRLTEEYNKQMMNCPKENFHFGNDMSTYYKPCGYVLDIKVKAGELLGYTIDNGYHSGIDIGLYNFNIPALEYISPSRYSEYNLHATCPLDLFTSEIKDKYYKKLGQISREDKYKMTETTFISRNIEPLCGQNMFDVPKTAKGNWYSGNKGVGSASTEYMMALVPDFINPNKYQISLKGPESLGTFVNIQFIPTHEGNINRAYEEVINDGKTYCYQDENNTIISKDKNGKTVPRDTRKFIIQLINNMHLKIEMQEGICTGKEVFQSPTNFER